jgi:hypothetical protein
MKYQFCITIISAMKKLNILVLAGLTVSISIINAQTVIITDSDLEGGITYNWTADNIYLLDGFVFLEAGSVLNIEEGTVIKAKTTPSTSDNASALIITRDAQIFAEGTANNPIIFTAEIDDTSIGDDLDETENGLWGGIIILGNATIAFSAAEGNIEGIPTTETRGFYGGTDDTDNSGTLRYVSIRHGGAALSSGNEINGLTLGAVGSNTTLEYIEVYANFDDGIEWFGGTVECKWCIAAFCGDDGMDFDEGWRGKGQFWFVIQREDSGDNGGEHDGANPDGATPFSNPVIYNATYIGSGIEGSAANANALLMRDATGGTYANSIFTEYANFAIEVEDLPAASGVDSRQRMEEGDLVLKNNIWWAFGAGDNLEVGSNGFLSATTDAEDPTAAFLVTHLSNNANTVEDPMLASISRFPNESLNPLPDPTGPAFSGLADKPSDAFYSDADYKGAFGTTNWALNWTGLDAEGFFGISTGIQQPALASLLPVFPNPANDQLNLTFELKENGTAIVEFIGLDGRSTGIAISTELVSGLHNIAANISQLNEGMYFVRLTSNGKTAVQKFTVLR